MSHEGITPDYRQKHW